jgi:epoxyqueuosine reductase
MVPLPVANGISKWLYRQFSQEVCPYNIKFSSELPERSPFAAREVSAAKDARTLAREILAMSQEEFTTAFRTSPMKRAKLRGLERNAAVVLGNAGDQRDIGILTTALDDPELLVRERAVWALERIATHPNLAASAQASAQATAPTATPVDRPLAHREVAARTR